MLSSFINILFPSRCLGCNAIQRDDVTLCGPCEASIKTHDALFCSECLARLPYGKKTCHKNTPHMLGLATRYSDEPVKNMIHALKFKMIRSAAKPLGALLLRYMRSTGFAFDSYELVPIPLHERRLRERGFNQAALIAEVLAGEFNLPLHTDLLTRTRNTAPQSEVKDFAKRETNVAGCFTASSHDTVRGKRILLIDDVVTSGATLGEAARALKAAGARAIVGLGVAKA